MIEVVEGNILNAKEFVIGHQVNCRGVMGGGLALQIRESYPEVYTNYKSSCNGISHDRLLGAVDYTHVPSHVIANLYGQDNYGGFVRNTNYGALATALNSLRVKCEKLGWSVALPYKLGCGLAGGDWEVVSELIVYSFRNFPYPVTIYQLEA